MAACVLDAELGDGGQSRTARRAWDTWSLTETVCCPLSYSSGWGRRGGVGLCTPGEGERAEAVRAGWVLALPPAAAGQSPTSPSAAPTPTCNAGIGTPNSWVTESHGVTFGPSLGNCYIESHERSHCSTHLMGKTAILEGSFPSQGQGLGPGLK